LSVERANLILYRIDTPLPIAKICNYVGDPYIFGKFGVNPSMEASVEMGEI